MASERVVRLVLTGDSAGAVRALEVAGAAAEKTQTKFETFQKVGRGMTSLGRSMTMLAVPLVALGAYSVKSAASFQKSMESIRTQAGQSQGEVNRMSKAVLNLAPSMGTSTTSLADGLYHIESAGYHGAQALKMLTVAAEGAKVGNANLTDVTNAMDAAVVSGIKGVGNYKQAMGALNATVGAGDMKMQDLADALGTGMLAPMKTYGLSLRDVGAALAVFGDNNIRGADAGTKLAAAMRIMAAPSAAASKALAGIGLSTLQLSTDLHSPGGIVAAFKDLKSHLTGSGESIEQQALTITRAFGGRQSTGVQLLLNQLPRLQAKVAEVAKGATGFDTDWQATTKTISFQWDKLKATGQQALIKLGDALMPLVTKYLPPLVNLLGGAVKWFTQLPKPVKEGVILFTAFLAIGGPILMFLGGLITAIGTVRDALALLGVTLEALPMIALFTAIGVSIYLLITHFRQVKQAALDVFRSIGAAVISMGTVLGRVFTGLFKIIVWPFKTAWTFIRGVFNGIMGDVRWLIGKITGAFKTIIGLPGKALSMAGSVLHTASFGLLNAGGPVKARYYDTGGPVGADTVPGWLTPGEFVLKKAAVSRVGVPALTALNEGGGMGGMGGNITIEPGQVIVKISERVVGEAAVRFFLKRGSRGSSSLVGGAMLTGSTTAG